MKLVSAILFVLLTINFAKSEESKVARSATSEYCSKNTISIGWHHYLPYSYLNPESKHISGSDIVLIKSILDKMGCRYSFFEMTWARTLSQLKQGEIDMSMYAYLNSQRKTQFLFSEPYRQESVRIAILKENRDRWSIESLDDLIKQNVLVAVDSHVWAGNAFKELVEHKYGNQVLHVHNINRRMQMLLEKRVDAILGDPLTIAIEAKKYSADKEYFFDDYVVFEQPVYFIFNKEKFGLPFMNEFNRLLGVELRQVN